MSTWCQPWHSGCLLFTMAPKLVQHTSAVIPVPSHQREHWGIAWFSHCALISWGQDCLAQPCFLDIHEGFRERVLNTKRSPCQNWAWHISKVFLKKICAHIFQNHICRMAKETENLEHWNGEHLVRLPRSICVYLTCVRCLFSSFLLESVYGFPPPALWCRHFPSSCALWFPVLPSACLSKEHQRAWMTTANISFF